MTSRRYAAAAWTLAALMALPAAGTGEAPDGARVEAGRYVSLAAHCENCHSGDPGKPWAGGYALETPFGVLVSPNITPHETGIGGWSFRDFEAALRQGHNPQGEPLYPAMPYTFYTRMTDRDVEDLWAFMQTLEPIENAVAVNRLPFPFNVRQSLEGWQALYFEPGRLEPIEGLDEQQQRGRYLIEAMGHCGACHTPRDALGGPKTGQALTGAELRNWYAPDISAGPGSVLAKWSEEELAAWLMGDHRATNAPAAGEMGRVIGASLARLRKEDVAAIAHWLKTMPPPQEAARTAFGPVEGWNAELGRAVYLENCESCHGRDGEGAYGLAASLVESGSVSGAAPSTLITVLLQGMEPMGDYGPMPAFNETLSDSELAAVANYVRTEFGGSAANVTDQLVAGMRLKVDAPSDALDRALACPQVPADHVDDETRQRLARIAVDGYDGAMLEALWTTHKKRVPDLDRSSRLVALTSGYCMAVYENGAEKKVLIEDQLKFSGAISDVAVQQGP